MINESLSSKEEEEDNCLVMSVRKLSPSYTDLLYGKRSLCYAHIHLQMHRLNIDGKAVSVDV